MAAPLKVAPAPRDRSRATFPTLTAMVSPLQIVFATKEPSTRKEYTSTC
jgi:hypothetical protein